MQDSSLNEAIQCHVEQRFSPAMPSLMKDLMRDANNPTPKRKSATVSNNDGGIYSTTAAELTIRNFCGAGERLPAFQLPRSRPPFVPG